MSSSNFAATSTDSDDTAASVAQVPAWAFVIAWSAEEPHRAGEVAFLPPFQSVLLGRGDQEMEKFIRFGIQRPGEPFAPSPRPGRELFAGTLLSRRQLLLRATADAVEVENLGKCTMLVNGEEKPVATLGEGNTVMLRSRGTRARRSQLLLLCQRRPRTLAGPRVLHAFGEPDDAGIVGEGPGAWNLREQIAGAAQAKVQKILVLGESGTGKEATANAIHRLSKRAKGPFVSRNAASFAMSVVDTELFGHPANFPSAGTPERKGLFGQADGGTLFFDEVADCSPEVQARLLRVLDKGEYQRVSESIARRVDIRFVGATNLDERTLRKELFGRFERIVRVPPLRQRREDIPLLIRHWVLRRVEGDVDLTSRYLQAGPRGKAEPKINGRLVDHLLRQELPLNVRELYAFLESTLSNPEDDLRLPKSMDPERTGVPPESPASTGDDGDGGIREDGLPSKVKLLAYLERAGGNVSEVARQVGKGRKVIYRLMEEYGIKGDGMQQALEYAEMIDVPFVFSSNGDAFLAHDRSGASMDVEREIPLDQFPSPKELWRRYCTYKGLTAEIEAVVAQDYYSDGGRRNARYYQVNAVNRAVEAVAKGQERLLLVMATGTGKTYTAFQIIWRLWKAGVKKRILFLADRNILIDQAKTNDFKPFGKAMTKIRNRKVNKAFEVYLALYQAISGTDEQADIFKQFSPDFFDLIVVDECHRGSAADNSAWRVILDYFSSATQIGLTATPKETADVSTTNYFGEPVYTYSLKQGIEDGFLAPYKVVRIDLDRDVAGWRPEKGKRDKHGEEIKDRIYNQRDFDRTLVLEQRTTLVARKLTEFLKATDRFDKTIVFCEDIDHAARMRHALVNENGDLCAQNRKYVMQITGDNDEGKAELDNFIHPEERYPVVVTTSKLLTTGVDAQTCKVIVLDQNIRSMSEFKQIIGRGTRIHEDTGKLFFTIIDFRKATEHFADPDFDGAPMQIYEPKEGDSVAPPPIDDDPESGAPALILEVDGMGAGADGILGGFGSDSPDDERTKRVKYVVADVPVVVVAERVQYYGKDGKLITESLKDYVRNALKTSAANVRFICDTSPVESARSA